MNPELIGQSDALLAVLEHTYRLAQITRPVLVMGERGTGKELIAHRLHYLSPRWQQPFVSLNCATLAETLLESELFGHEAGAFTGAQKRHLGRFERADGGTLFLDELASTSPRVQEKLLRVIEYGEFERVGGSQSVSVNVRLVCASNQDLPMMAEKGQFRADLRRGSRSGICRPASEASSSTASMKPRPSASRRKVSASPLAWQPKQ